MANPMENFSALGDQFVKWYYATFDEPSTRAQLQGVFLDAAPGPSLMTYGDATPSAPNQFGGMQGIMTKITTGLGYGSVKHVTTTIDSQPAPNNTVVVAVTGKLAVDGNTTTPLNFAQTFVLALNPANNQPYVHNTIFKLCYA